MQRATRKNDECKKINREDKKVYHSAKALLKIYSQTAWETSDKYNDVIYTYKEEYGLNDIDGLEIIATFDENNESKDLVCKLLSLGENKLIIDIIHTALIKLKSYPYKGELYFSIINKNYLIKTKYTESEILENLGLSRTTYYRRRKEAIHLFGVCLWKFTIPNVLKLFNYQNGTKMEQDWNLFGTKMELNRNCFGTDTGF